MPTSSWPLGEPLELPVAHPYLHWFAQALGMTVLRLVDEPWLCPVTS